MRLRIVGINYSPEVTGNAPYTTGLAEALAALGDEVGVTAGYPHYPEWRVRDGWTGSRTERIENGVRVEHLRHVVPTRPSQLKRLLMELQFGLRASLRGWGRPEVAVLVSPALFSSWVALQRARLGRIPRVVWVQDIYSLGVVQAAGAGGLVAGAMRRVERSVLRGADRVVVIHERFRRFLVDELGIDPASIEIVRNWSHVEPPTGVDRAAVRARMGWGVEDIVVLHAGNMGVKQGLENVVHAARVAEDRGSRVRFVLLGDGNQREGLERASTSSRLSFVDPVAEEELMPTLAAADILLVNELPGLTEMSVPSKLTTYFATGLPVLAATDAASVTAEEMERSGAGLRVDAAAPEQLVDGAERIAADPVLARALGDAGQRFREATLTERASTGAFREILARLVR